MLVEQHPIRSPRTRAPGRREHALLSPSSVTRGFTLTELTIVLVIVALLIGGMLLPLSAQRELQGIRETEVRLTEVKDALLGFAVAHGRLPCPAAPPPAGGVESPVGTGVCTNPLDGFVPAATLGLAPTDAQGYLLDAWGNPIRYSVYADAISTQANPFTTAGKMKEIRMETLSLSKTSPVPVQRNLLFVCASAPGEKASSCGSATMLADNAVAVVFSSGKNTPTSGTATDEGENLDGDSIFVAHTQTEAGASGGKFDDIITWISPNVLFSRMISGGRLP